MRFCHLLILFKLMFSNSYNVFQEYHQSVKQLRSDQVGPELGPNSLQELFE